MSAARRTRPTTSIADGGTVNIAANVNGDEQNIMLGSQERPFRWLGGRLDDAATSAVLSQTPKYDWNTTTHQWEPVAGG